MVNGPSEEEVQVQENTATTYMLMQKNSDAVKRKDLSQLRGFLGFIF